MLTDIACMGRARAECVDPSAEQRPVAVISLTDSATPANLAPGFWDVLHIDCSNPGTDHARATSLSVEDAEEILRFVDQANEAQPSMRLIVHCEFGLSRSVAVAGFVGEMLRLPVRFAEYERGAKPRGSEHVRELLEEAAGIVNATPAARRLRP